MLFISFLLYSYLPLSHIAAQMSDIYLPLTAGASVHFAKPDALKVLSISIYFVSFILFYLFFLIIDFNNVI